MSDVNPYNPYIPSTCPSQRFCKNHKYNTGGLFTAFYNENSSLHCGQEHIEYPKFEKSCGGSALPGNTYLNVQPGEQLVACNGREYTDMYTNSNIASMRTGYIEPGKSSPSPGVVVAQRTGGKSVKKEGFANTTDPAFTTHPLGLQGSQMTSSTAVKPLVDYVCGGKKKTGVEKFCAACASPCGCAVLGVIVAILAIWLLVKCSDCWARDKTGRGIFTVGGMNSINVRGNQGNMNITGGNADDDFAII